MISKENQSGLNAPSSPVHAPFKLPDLTLRRHRLELEMSTTLHEDLVADHEQMLGIMRRARLALLLGDIAQARESLGALHELQQAHIAHEEGALIPRLPASARWAAKVYLAEHGKLSAMLTEWRHALSTLPSRLSDGEERLALLDATLPLQHLLEHHFEREEKGLFVDIQV